MFRRLPPLLAVLLATCWLAVAGVAAAADARQELHAAYRKMMAATAFKATLVDLGTGKTAMTMEFQAPDRYRMTVPGQPSQLIIGVVVGITLGVTGLVGGQPARIYRHTTQVDGKPAQTLVWVGVASGLPLQVETRGAKGGKDVRILYSDFNSPKIRIEAPK